MKSNSALTFVKLFFADLNIIAVKRYFKCQKELLFIASLRNNFHPLNEIFIFLEAYYIFTELLKKIYGLNVCGYVTENSFDTYL